VPPARALRASQSPIDGVNHVGDGGTTVNLGDSPLAATDIPALPTLTREHHI